MKKFFLLFLLFPTIAMANTKNDMCEIAGFFSGRQEMFLAKLAQYENINSGFFIDGQCHTLFQAGFTLGKKTISERPPWSENELSIIRKSKEFENKILKTILELSGNKINKQ